MSYILDALKKSELERRQGEIPDLQTAPSGVAVTRDAGPARSLYLAAAALLLGAGVLLGWLRPWERKPAMEISEPAAIGEAHLSDPQREERMPQPSAPIPERTTGRVPSALARPAPQPSHAAQTERDQPREIMPPAALAMSAATKRAAHGAGVEARAQVAADARLTPPRSEPVSVASRKEPSAAAMRESAGPGPSPKPVDRVVSFSDLPPAVRRSLPRLSLSGFAHADETELRMAVINDRVLREGEELSPGLKLERIAPDGVVLNYQGHRFRPGE